MLGPICEGCNSKEMAGTLHLSPPTIGDHLASLYRKVGVGSRFVAAV